MEEFYQLIREQVLYDTGEYLTRMGTEIYQRMRQGGEEKLAKRIRDTFYGCAHQVRNNGRTGREEVEQMLQAMRGQTITIPDGVNQVMVHLDDRGEVPLAAGPNPLGLPFEVREEEDGDPA
jgi:hypothetical protein